MATPGQGRCAYCGGTNVPLRRLNSTELLEMMKSYNAAFTRRTVFCNPCTTRMTEKFKKRKTRQRLQERQAMTSVDDRTTSYSNASSAVLSQSSSQRRNVAKRTAGAPKNRSTTSSSAGRQANNDPDDDPDDDPDSGSEMVVNFPDSSSNRSSQQNSTSSSTRNRSSPRRSSPRRSNQSHTSNVDYGNDDDGIDNNANQTDNGNSVNSVSSQAPMPTTRHQRTQSLSSSAAQLSPSRMASMTSSERSDTMRNYNRGGGG